MEILNIASTLLWIVMAVTSLKLMHTLIKIHGEDHQFLVFTINILLLAGLNICIGLFTFFNDPDTFENCSSLQKLYFGTSLFQLLLSYCVIERIKRVGLKLQ